MQCASIEKSVGHNEKPSESFHEVTQVIEIHGQPTEKDLTGGKSAGHLVNMYVSPYNVP